MTRNEVKPGTRCECRDYDCARKNAEDGTHRTFPDDCCPNDAVRLVTVRSVETTWDRKADVYFDGQVPMCDACACWHEEKAHA